MVYVMCVYVWCVLVFMRVCVVCGCMHMCVICMWHVYICVYLCMFACMCGGGVYGMYVCVCLCGTCVRMYAL